jgi:hypothetical protein
MNLWKLVLGLALIGFGSCSSDDQTLFLDDESITSINGTWKVQSFENLQTHSVEIPTQENSWGRDILITFDDSRQPNVLTGENTTNSFAGEFVYTGLREFKLKELFSTKVGQPEWANKFTAALLASDIQYEINSTQLRIYYSSKSKSMTLTRE